MLDHCEKPKELKGGGRDTRDRDPCSKLQHIAACLNDDVEYRKSPGFEKFEFINQALPEISLQGIDLSTSLVNKSLNAPLMIAPMTGGNPRSHEINQLLARAAQRWQIAFGVGSQRVAIEDPSCARYFELRTAAPNTVIFANLGAIQLVRGWQVAEAVQAVEMIGADGLFIHLNAMQEAIQGEEHDFRGLTASIGKLCEALHKICVPVFVREVGFGLSRQAAIQLMDCGIAGIDCAGAGGTSWAKVEASCAKSERRRSMGQCFSEWGIPTSQSIQNVRDVSSHIPLIATGGIRSGMDLAKALALGADIGAIALPFLFKAQEGEEAIDQFISKILMELRICMFGIGAAKLSELKNTPYLTHC
jgi:isopentenyl-diphosphate delta-isomerase